MRRRPFFIAPLAALVTFVALSAFVGHRHWGPHPGGWRHHHHYDGRFPHSDRFNDSLHVPYR